MPMSEFHQIAFDAVEEAAAFIAALTRRLASPRTDLPRSNAVEVAAVVRTLGADVYLSPAALIVAERA